MNELLKELLSEVKKFNSNLYRPPTNNLTNKHYTIEELSKLMNVSENTVRNWIKDGVIQPFQYKGTLRIREANLERFITKYSG